MSRRAAALLLWGLLACTAAAPSPPVAPSLVTALRDIHRRPSLAELRERFEDVERQLIAIAEDDGHDWLVRGRSYEILTESEGPEPRAFIERALEDETLPPSVRRALIRRTSSE